MNSSTYNFTNSWFESDAKGVWDFLIPQINPTKILEVGSYEGASTCYLIEKLAASKEIEIHCIDTWEGGVEHKKGGVAEVDMSDVEKRFHHNTKMAISKVENTVELMLHKGFSDVALSKLITDGKQGYFDFIYVDGSHQATDVLCDALLGFRLLKNNGVIAFDDYLWQEELAYGTDPIRCPKTAIDAFTNIYCRKIRIIRAPLYQLYVQKISD
ncbi:class I SAM-dependent methyltransferase [Polynucleobacter nymphae]|uniref:class I SAM-dependent methyltransferase n=1 Tax=Polynucleobacter nymphae TaxID=2081043 RepID=UPI001C0B114D|nr:class I SAM-dependent methyltransferase [Polynucleobacter nymphae]MBU3607487.1 class I SAM-dependent methyltransferase [Polynucleobacter nymphae]